LRKINSQRCGDVRDGHRSYDAGDELREDLGGAAVILLVLSGRSLVA